ncbi:MAG: hypothetical protein ACOX2L_01480 [Anaerolineae bacterium]|jgi:hypothetical protein|nr:hypothetical protein [Chloroflexota bacterium]
MRERDGQSERLAPQGAELLALILRLMPPRSRGGAGIPVGQLAGEILKNSPAQGGERARLYMALLEELRRAVEAMPELRYVTGIT